VGLPVQSQSNVICSAYHIARFDSIRYNTPVKIAPDLAPEAILKTAGLRRTPVRMGVLRVLAKSADPLAVPAILERLPEHTDAVTVYRTLNSFTRKKLVHRVRGEDRTWRYALEHTSAAPAHQHPHFVCEDCGKVECIEQATIPERFVKSLSIDARYSVSYAEVLLHGRCAKCQA